MNELDAIAHLLAARHDESVRETPEYLEAKKLMEADADGDGDNGIAMAVEREAEFYDEHHDLLAGVELPELSKARILKRLKSIEAEIENEEKTQLNRGWMMVAAIMLCLVAGFGSIRYLDQGTQLVQIGDPITPETPVGPEAFREYAVEWIDSGVNFEKRSSKEEALIAFLAKESAPAVAEFPVTSEEVASLGCQVKDWRGKRVSLICYKKNQQIVHLFITEVDGLVKVERSREEVGGIDTMTWSNNQYAYVLVANDPGETLEAFGFPPQA